mgnify:CR=1 FL=1
MGQPNAAEEIWRAILTGQYAPLRRGRKIFKFIPSQPRCKFCNAPFGSPGKFISALLGKRPSRKNPNFCDICALAMQIGGAEIELTMLFTDVRGSTALAEKLGAASFSRCLNRFYKIAVDILIGSDALVDKFVGDEVIGLFIPGFAGPHHARLALEAAEEILFETGHRRPEGPWLPLGAGIHTGTAYVGAIGTPEGVNDLTALGDSVNTTARLASQAQAGEILISEDAYQAAGAERDGSEQRYLQLKGKSKPVCVRVLKSVAA